ncbi:MAG: hypothetical protein R3B54_15615 [Bdellovibrionota bacterium]
MYKSIDKLGNEEKNKTVTYHMIGSTPVVDLFVSDGQSHEERVRTNFFENNVQRDVANDPPQAADPVQAPVQQQPAVQAPPVQTAPKATAPTATAPAKKAAPRRRRRR